MQKILWLLLAGVATVSATSCGFFDDQSTPEGYVRHCIRLLDEQALYANTPEWREAKKEMLEEAKVLATMDEAHALVTKAAKMAGGKHSNLVAPVEDTASYKEFAPEVKMLECGIAYIQLPAHSGVKVTDSLYLHTVLDFLQENLNVKGVVLDLRDNTGGNMYPMIASLSPLLPNGTVISFKSRKCTSPITLDYVMREAGLQGDISKFPAATPIAVLTNERTGSSGEATLLCFRGLDNIRTFGVPTAGYASSNVTHILDDGYTLLITMSCDVARTGEVFCDDPIVPDVNTETPLEDAIGWIESLKSVAQ